MLKDYSAGFGGKYGVQKDRQDKAAHTYEEREALAKHESQKGEKVLRFFNHLHMLFLCYSSWTFASAIKGD